MKAKKEALVYLIHKPDGGSRPLSIFATMWRLGATAVAQKLQPWAARWAESALQGGLGRRGLANAHGRLAAVLVAALDADYEAIVVTQDCSVSPAQAVSIAVHLGLPRNVASVLGHFYDQQKRIFVSRGICGEAWLLPRQGLAQGCPLSPLLLGCVMAVWNTATSRGDSETIPRCIYLDDRTWVATFRKERRDQALEALQLLRRQSDEVDVALGLESHPDKCITARRRPGRRGLQGAQRGADLGASLSHRQGQSLRQG